MMQHGDWYRFLWLIVPVGWCLYAFWRIWLRHRQAQKTLEVLAVYAQQNKEPPAQLLMQLQSPSPVPRFLTSGIIVGGVALAFLVLRLQRLDDSDMDAGLTFVIVILVVISLTMFLRAWLAAKAKILPPLS
jgi:hypothetical protein